MDSFFFFFMNQGIQRSHTTDMRFRLYVHIKSYKEYYKNPGSEGPAHHIFI